MSSGMTKNLTNLLEQPRPPSKDVRGILQKSTSKEIPEKNRTTTSIAEVANWPPGRRGGVCKGGAHVETNAAAIKWKQGGVVRRRTLHWIQRPRAGGSRAGRDGRAAGRAGRYQGRARSRLAHRFRADLSGRGREAAASFIRRIESGGNAE